MANLPTEFGVRIPDIFVRGFNGWRKNIIPLSLAGIVVVAVAALFAFFQQELNDAGRPWSAFAVLSAGWIVAGTVAYPWYFYALRAARGEPIELAAPFAKPLRFAHQAVSSFFFWAGIMLGVRYPVFGVPILSMLVLVSYAFHGFVIADVDPKREGTRGATYALGTSVRLGDKRRFGIFAIACLLGIFNFFGLSFGIVLENTIEGYLAAIAGLAITGSITMVGGAYLYDELVAKMPKGKAPAIIRTKGKRKQGKKRG